MIGKRLLKCSQQLFLAVVLVSLVILMVPASAVLADAAVDFPDAALEAAVRDTLGIPSGDIYESDLAGLTELTASGVGIEDLTGLEHCVNLTVLQLSNNLISDLTPLSGLPLDILELDHNQISGIGPFAGLPHLMRFVLLDHNQISDITPLSHHSFADALSLSCNLISDLSGIHDFGAYDLTLDHNLISDVSPLANYPSVRFGNTVDLRANPLSCTSISTYIPMIEANDVIVYYDPLCVPALVSPANGAVTCDRTPYLDWTRVTAASTVHYRLQVDNNADFSSPVVNRTWVSYSYYTVTATLTYGTRYYWRVRSVDAIGNMSAWTRAWSFKVARAAPGVPALVSPANGSSSTHHTPYLDWTRVTGCSTIHYRLQVDNNADFSSPVVNKTWVSYSYYHVTTYLSHGKYYWRVRAVDASGNMSPWSGPWTFTIA